MTEKKQTEDLRAYVRQRYGAIAEAQGEGAKDRSASMDQNEVSASSCCEPAPADVAPEGTAASSSCCGPAPAEQVENIQFYETSDAADLPGEVTDLSLGCGDPVTLASLQPGQTVLDLGSGGGIDCFLAAKRVGPEGRVIGVDMTPAMLDRARASKEKLGADNVEFRLGEIEHLPVPDSSVDVIISNCVINLSPDKPQVLREAYRVLKPGGKLAVSDIVTNGPLPSEIKASLSAWAGCVAGALEVPEYVSALSEAGFENVELSPVYFDRETVDNFVADQSDEFELSGLPEETLYHGVFSARITAQKPR
jgi:SAM-dependent methyltransferase